MPKRTIDRVIQDPVAALRALDRADCEEHLIDFAIRGWHALEPTTPVVRGWAMDAICEHLEAVSAGQITRLLINVPPGFSKSLCTNVFWPAWEWGPKNHPGLRYISASYSGALSVRDNVRCRDLINSDWYQSLWGDRFSWKGDQREKVLYENDKTGWRFAGSVGGAITGRRGDRIIIDDPHDVRDAESEAIRNEALRWFSEVMPTRMNDQEKTPRVIIMQRVHENDISGLILANELGYDRLVLPMEYEPDHPFISSTKLNFQDPRTTPGQLLWPERFSQVAVEQLKADFRAWGGTYAEAGQLQQRPAPRGGGMFQSADLSIVEYAPPGLSPRCRGWDLAATKDGGDWTVGVLLGRGHDGRIYVEDVVRQQLSPGGVEDLLRRTAARDGSGVVQDLPQDPGQAGKAQTAAFARLLAGYDVRFGSESGDKKQRARPLAAQAEGGNVRLVRGRWCAKFTDELSVFPAGRYDDQVDAASRAYSRVARGEMDYVPVAPRIIDGDL